MQKEHGTGGLISMSDVKGLIFDINENEIMSHIEDGTLSQFLESWFLTPVEADQALKEMKKEV